MRDTYQDQLNKLLVDIFSSVLNVEEQTLKNTKLDISISELHTLEAVAKFGSAGSSISALAQELNVTTPTVTVAIKKLQSKRYVEKVRDAVDGRKVSVVLTREGRRIDAVHRYFHEQMVRSFIREVGTQEQPVLLNALQNLQAFLHGRIQAFKEHAVENGK